MRTTILLLLVGILAVPFRAGVLAAPAPEPLKLEERIEIEVTVKTLALEIRKLADLYEKGIDRRFQLKEILRAVARAPKENRSPYQQAVLDQEQTLKEIKEKWVAIELQRAKLLSRLGKKDGEAAPESTEKMHSTLEKILERLITVEKHLEKR